MDIEDVYEKLGPNGSAVAGGAVVGLVHATATATGMSTVAGVTGSVISTASSAAGLAGTAGSAAGLAVSLAPVLLPTAAVLGVGYGVYKVVKWLSR